MKTYIDELIDQVQQRTGLKGKEILKMYALLVLVKGTDITLSDVHDAWSMVMNFKEANPPYCYGHEHRSIVPFEQLPVETQKRDEEYVEALVKLAKDNSEAVQ